MAKNTIPLAAYLRSRGVEADSDFLRQGVMLLTRLLTEAEVSQRMGAEGYERNDGRQG